jgi:hypothetical protein
VGRAPAFWSEENTRLIKQHFVPVAVSNVEQQRQDAVGWFFRDAGMRLPGAGGSQWCVTASGKVLESNNHSGLGFNMKEALRKWRALPAAERAPGAVKVGELGEIDVSRALPSPPPGGLIVKVYYRAFMRDGGKLRYVVGKDLWHDEQGQRTDDVYDVQYPGTNVAPQAQPDHMWLSEGEWKSLLPAAPREGETHAVPAAITDRIIRWHLNPLTVYGVTNALNPQAVRAGELNLTVDSVAPESVRLRLDGFASLGTAAPPPDVVAGKRACMDHWGYEPRLLGMLEYDPNGQRITRFDVVALGDHFGPLATGDGASRVGLQPLGISFELVTKASPADCYPPGRARSLQDYFGK